MHSKTDKIASRHLGKKSVGSENYNPSLLVAVPRSENRKQYNIDNENLPFQGWDIWHAYEFSCLTENGVPLTRVLKLKYNCNNKYLIESKSLKLYLNSFNMSKFGKNFSEALSITQKIIERDLSEKLETNVEVCFIDLNAKQVEIYTQFKNIMDYIDEDKLIVSSFKEAPEYLKFSQCEQVKENYLMFDSLRSNCRVTHQPDFGKAFIYYKSKKHIDETSLVQYLSSFRSEFHFHEECCEMIFKRLANLLNDNDELFISALYTRRGGIDICPSRWKNCELKDIKTLLDLNIYASIGTQF